MFTESSSLDLEKTAIVEKMKKQGLGPQLIAFEAALDEAKVSMLTKYLFVCDKAGKKVLFHDVRASDSAAANSVTEKRLVLRKILKNAGVKIPNARHVRTANVAEKARKGLGKSVNVWSVEAGNKKLSEAVTTQKRLQQVFERHHTDGKGVLLEEHIPGDSFRVLVIGSKVVAVLGKRPASVTGNGESTIEELVEIKNEKRKVNPCYLGKLIKLDKAAQARIKRAGLTADSVLPDGQYFELGKSLGISFGGEFFDVTDTLHPEVEEAAINAVKAIPGLEVAGVDVVQSSSGSDTSSYVVGVCCNPNIGIHHFPMEGSARNVAREIWVNALNTLK